MLFTYLRSILFMISFYLYSLLIFIIMLPTFLLPKRQAMIMPIAWTSGTMFLLRHVAGVKLKVEGKENLPKQGGYIVASKHQSAMETLMFHTLVPQPFYIFKKELIWLPFAGLYALKTGNLPIDRAGGATAMRKMLNGASKRFQEGMHMIIFPEGTRTPPDKRTEEAYHPGVALIYEKCQVPCVPVALNTGYCWPKNSFLRLKGTVTVRFLKPIETGLNKRDFLARLQNTIEDEQAKLPTPFKKGQ